MLYGRPLMLFGIRLRHFFFKILSIHGRIHCTHFSLIVVANSSARITLKKVCTVFMTSSLFWKRQHVPLSSALRRAKNRMVPNPDYMESVALFRLNALQASPAPGTRSEAEHCHDAESMSFSSAGASGEYGAATVAGRRSSVQHLWSFVEVSCGDKWTHSNRRRR